MHANTLTLDAARAREAELLRLAAPHVAQPTDARRRRLWLHPRRRTLLTHAALGRVVRPQGGS